MKFPSRAKMDVTPIDVIQNEHSRPLGVVVS